MIVTISSRHSCRRFEVRRGSVVPLLALLIVALTGFLALAIDVGMLTISKAQAQNAADLASLTSARSLTGDSSNNYNEGTATSNAQAVITYNNILGQSLTASQLTLTYGTYDYNQTTQTFNANFPPTSGVPLSAVAATITSSGSPSAFSAIFGLTSLNSVTATATAVHRPRDIALVMDLSGSMRFGTCLGFDFWTNTRTCNNPDSNYPTFGQYSSGSAGMQGPSTNQTSSVDNYTISPANVTVGNSSYSLTYLNNFYQNAAYAGTLIRAFDSYTSTDSGSTWVAPTSGSPTLPPTSYATTPGGDVPLFKSGSTITYATDVKDVLGGTTTRSPAWELDGYSNYTNGSLSSAANGQANYTNAPFYGYTQGPNYYGETFFIWPPDPRQPLTSASNSSQLQQFLTDFGYTANDFNSTSQQTTLSAKISSTTATSLTVSSSSGFPSVSFKIQIDSEHMTATTVTGTNWTVTRGVDSTTKATHSNGATVSLLTGPPLSGIYNVTTTTNSQNWPWPNDGGTTLSNYLKASVYIPGGSRLLQSTDAQYEQIMRLYNWNYVIDNLGTTPCDWRVRFFGTNDNTKIFNGSGSLNTPGGSTYTINYSEILRWIAAAPNPFPSQLRAGRVKYYGSIPTAISGSWPSYTNTDQRFWKEFIDYALGFMQTSSNGYTDVSAMAGYGGDFTWGSKSINGPPGGSQYMNYSDNPLRGKLRFWFGPLMMVDYLNNYNLDDNVGSYFYMQPGDSYEAPLYTGKQSFLAAINTIESNHPNDWFSFCCYSWPRTNATSTGRFNCVSCPLGTNYAYGSAALFFPFSTINADGSCNNSEITPYDKDAATSAIPSSNFSDTPRADGDTCFAMALMLCYNQFVTTLPTDATLRSYVSNTPITFPSGMAGGMGRKGAQKVVIFETDGLPNCGATANLVTPNGSSYSYYPIRYDMNNPNSSEYPSINPTNLNDSGVVSQINTLVARLASDFGTSRNPFRLYAMGFGPVFEGTDASAAETTLQGMQYNAGTQSSPSTPLPTNQIITGSDTTMSTNMVSAFTSILQNGVQIALIK